VRHFFSPRTIETHCAGTKIAPLFTCLCFLDVSLFRLNRPILAVTNQKWRCSTGRGDENGSREQRHFCPLAAILENTCDASRLSRYGHRDTSCGRN